MTSGINFATLVNMTGLFRAYTTLKAFLSRIARPLRSRKTRIALATLGSLYFVERGYDVSEAFMLAVITLSASLILGTAIEDAGHKANGGNSCGP